MKKIFVVGDTHKRMILPPPDCDLSIHCGDFVEAFDTGKLGERADIYRRRFAQVRAAYDHVVEGNHERLFYQRFGGGPGIDDLPEVVTVQVEGVTIRVSHYLTQMQPGSSALSPAPTILLPSLYRGLARSGANIVLYGHTHYQRHDVCEGVHFVDVGAGDKGDAVEIIVDGSMIVDVKMIHREDDHA